MKVHLDTSFLIRALVRDSAQDAKLRQWIGAGTLLEMSAIAWAEFLCGPVNAVSVDLATRVVRERKPFSEEDAVLAAELFNQSGRRRGSFADCMIAAAALQGDAALATVNEGDFERIAPEALVLITA